MSIEIVFIKIKSYRPEAYFIVEYRHHGRESGDEYLGKIWLQVA